MEKISGAEEWSPQAIWWHVTAGLYFAAIRATTEFEAIIRAQEERQKAKSEAVPMVFASPYPLEVQKELDVIVPPSIEVLSMTGEQALHPERHSDVLKEQTSTS